MVKTEVVFGITGLVSITIIIIFIFLYGSTRSKYNDLKLRCKKEDFCVSRGMNSSDCDDPKLKSYMYRLGVTESTIGNTITLGDGSTAITAMTGIDNALDNVEKAIKNHVKIVADAKSVQTVTQSSAYVKKVVDIAKKSVDMAVMIAQTNYEKAFEKALFDDVKKKNAIEDVKKTVSKINIDTNIKTSDLINSSRNSRFSSEENVKVLSDAAEKAVKQIVAIKMADVSQAKSDEAESMLKKAELRSVKMKHYINRIILETTQDIDTKTALVNAEKAFYGPTGPVDHIQIALEKLKTQNISQDSEISEQLTKNLKLTQEHNSYIVNTKEITAVMDSLNKQASNVNSQLNKIKYDGGTVPEKLVKQVVEANAKLNEAAVRQAKTLTEASLKAIEKSDVTNSISNAVLKKVTLQDLEKVYKKILDTQK